MKKRRTTLADMMAILILCIVFYWVGVTKHSDGLPPLIRHVGSTQDISSVDGSPDAGVGRPDCVDHPRVEEDQKENGNQIEKEKRYLVNRIILI